MQLQMCPNGTLTSTQGQLTGIKKDKSRVTLLIGSNILGDERKIIMIRKHLKPRCFKGKNISSNEYLQSQKAWMSRKLFFKIMLEWNTQLKKDERKILVIVDNASCHKLEQDEEIQLSQITLKFLPPSTTALCQPCDQGIIKCFKDKFRQMLIRRQIVFAENKKSF
uniref:DDE-1 domain-containing protein n=1 Tax=Strongyloides papillosus TaxID=174720 RepID=A0A0N5BQ91_STREA